ncbi:MAG: clostripain-related cysteine peptidase [bacterium]
MDIKATNGYPEPIGSKVGASSAPVKKETPAAEVKDSVVLGGKVDDVQAKPHKKWLFLNYVAADCNLTEYQMGNLDQQEMVGSDKNTHIAAFIDIGDKNNSFGEKWQDCRQYYITKDSEQGKLNSEVVKEYGPTDMASPKTLKDFLVDAVKRYPADHVALILNDHGGGFTGAMYDDGSGGFMTVPKIRQAIEDAEKITGKKLDIIGMDACLMGETEVAYELKDSAKYLLASEESEGGAGWSYDSMLGGKTLSTSIQKLQKALKSRIEVGPEEFSKIVVDVNRKHSEDIPTFSATDLSKMNILKDSVNTLAEAMLASKDKANIRTAISKSENYGSGYTPYKDLRDVVDMANKMIETSKDKAVKEAAKALIESLGTVVLANENDPSAHPESHGLSIYAPTRASGQLGYGYNELSFPKDTKWDEAILSLSKPSSEGDGSQPAKPVADRPDTWPDGTPFPKK